MMSVEKFQSLRTGVAPADTEHWWLFTNIALIELSTTPESYRNALLKVLEEWEKHIAIEEEWLAAKGSVNLVAHHANHLYIATTMRCLIDGLPQVITKDLVEHVSDELEAVICKHITHFDLPPYTTESSL